MEIPEPRKTYFFIFYSEYIDTYWVFPSLELVALASRNKKGANEGKYHVNLTGNSQKRGGIYALDKYRKYQTNFDLLRT